jgi:hypothetical protein
MLVGCTPWAPLELDRRVLAPQSFKYRSTCPFLIKKLLGLWQTLAAR